MRSPGKQNSKTKSAILDAARRQFAHFGFSKVTMGEIAVEAAMAKASLYYYFPTKENLFHAVMVNEHQEFMNSFRAILERDLSAADRVRAYVNLRYEYFNKMLTMNILDLRSSGTMKPVFAATYEDFSRQELKVLRLIIEDGRARKEFVVRSADKIAEALHHVTQGLRCRFVRAAGGPRIEPKEYNRLKQELQFVTDIFLRGIGRQN
jgi:AcrR family transcriptional regulator